GHHVHGTWRDGAGGARPVGHADHLPPARVPAGRGMVVSQDEGSGMRKNALLPAALAVALFGVGLSGTALVAPVAAQDGEAHLLIVTGLSGEDRFARAYAEWGAALTDAAVARFGMEPGNVA